MKVSVIIPTLNRCEKLKLVLDAFKESGQASAFETEVLIVDNNSKDSTRHLVGTYLPAQNLAFRYIFEGKRGKSHALNTGIAAAGGELLVFTDDDCVPSTSWLENIVREFEQDPHLAVIGGRVELYNQDDWAHAISLSRQRAMITDAADVLLRPMIMGGNMAWRRQAFGAVPQFDTVLGPGAACRSAEDIEVLYRIFKAGFKMVYSPEVLVFHNHGRKTQAQDDALGRAYTIGRGGLYCKHILQWDAYALGIASLDVYGTAKTLIKGFFTRKISPYHKLVLPALVSGAFFYLKYRKR